MINPRNLIDENQPLDQIMKQLDGLGRIDQNLAIREAKRIGAAQQQKRLQRRSALKANLLGAADPPGMARTPGTRSWPDAPTVDFNGAGPRSSAPDRVFAEAFTPPASPDSLTVLRDRLMSPDRPQDVYGPSQARRPASYGQADLAYDAGIANGPTPPPTMNRGAVGRDAALAMILGGAFGGTRGAAAAGTGYLNGAQQAHEGNVSDWRIGEQHRRQQQLDEQEAEDRAARARHQAAVDAHLMAADEGDALELLTRGVQGLDDAGVRAYLDMAERTGLMRRAGVDPASLKDNTGAWGVGALTHAARPVAVKPIDPVATARALAGLDDPSQAAVRGLITGSGRPGGEAFADLPTLHAVPRPKTFRDTADGREWDALTTERKNLMNVLTMAPGRVTPEVRRWAIEALKQNEYGLQSISRRNGGQGANLAGGDERLVAMPDMTPKDAANVQAAKDRQAEINRHNLVGEKQADKRIDQGERRTLKALEPKPRPGVDPRRARFAEQQMADLQPKIDAALRDVAQWETEETSLLAQMYAKPDKPDLAMRSRVTNASTRKRQAEERVRQLQAEMNRLRGKR